MRCFATGRRLAPKSRRRTGRSRSRGRRRGRPLSHLPRARCGAPPLFRQSRPDWRAIDPAARNDTLHTINTRLGSRFRRRDDGRAPERRRFRISPLPRSEAPRDPGPKPSHERSRLSHPEDVVLEPPPLDEATCRRTEKKSSSTSRRRPFGSRPMKALLPPNVPEQRSRSATRSPSTIASTIVSCQSGKAARNNANPCRTAPARCEANKSLTPSSSPALISSSTNLASIALISASATAIVSILLRIDCGAFGDADRGPQVHVERAARIRAHVGATSPRSRPSTVSKASDGLSRSSQSAPRGAGRSNGAARTAALSRTTTASTSLSRANANCSWTTVSWR